MTLKEIVLLVLGFLVSCAVLLVCIALIVRRAQRKQSKHDRSGDHYHESGTGLDG